MDRLRDLRAPRPSDLLVSWSIYDPVPEVFDGIVVVEVGWLRGGWQREDEVISAAEKKVPLPLIFD
jgi:hypothetical protein